VKLTLILRPWRFSASADIALFAHDYYKRIHYTYVCSKMTDDTELDQCPVREY
jgi:hypothetical protein